VIRFLVKKVLSKPYPFVWAFLKIKTNKKYKKQNKVLKK